VGAGRSGTGHEVRQPRRQPDDRHARGDWPCLWPAGARV
jgi:hypothetical protein